MATKFGGKNPCPEHNALLGNAANATVHYAAAGALVITIIIIISNGLKIHFTLQTVTR